MTPKQQQRIGKSYADMTEQERKDWFGYCFKRSYQIENISESYVCDIRDINELGSGYGVIRWQPNPDDPNEIYDPQCTYDIDELKQYMIDYPEMIVPGWIAPLTTGERELVEIRTEWVNLSDDELKQKLYTMQYLNFTDDDIWNGSSSNTNALLSSQGIEVMSDEPVELTDDNYIITWKGLHCSCDDASRLVSMYSGDNDEKAEQVKMLRNKGKEYIRTVVDKFLAEHGGKPEPPTFPTRYVQ